MKKIMIYTGMAAAGVALLSSCYFGGPCLDGSGPVIEEVRQIDDFYGVSNTTSFDVHVSRADSFSVVVAAPENLIDFIETYRSGRTLVIDTENFICISGGNPVDIYVTLPEAEELRNSGSGTITATNVESDQVEIRLSGSGSIMVDSVFCSEATINCSSSGEIAVGYIEAGDAVVKLSGSGDIDAPECVADEMRISLSSSGDIRLGVFNALMVEAVVSGSGKVLLEGDAVFAEFTISSSGRIDAFDMPANDAEVTSSGSGDTYVYAYETLDVTILASGDVIYGGNPDLSYRITGSGSVRRY